MSTVFIGIGSNLGDREKNIANAIDCLKNEPKITIEKISSIIETVPVGGPPQNKYLNGVIKISTVLSPENLLEVLQNIENKLGRKRSLRFGPRTIDLDILLYDDRIIDNPRLKIPHPRMYEREFVLKPLFEIEPEVEKLVNKLKLKASAQSIC